MVVELAGIVRVSNFVKSPVDIVDTLGKILRGTDTEVDFWYFRPEFEIVNFRSELDVLSWYDH